MPLGIPRFTMAFTRSLKNLVAGSVPRRILLFMMVGVDHGTYDTSPHHHYCHPTRGSKFHETVELIIPSYQRQLNREDRHSSVSRNLGKSIWSFQLFPFI